MARTRSRPSVPVSEVRFAPPPTAAVEVPLVQTGGPTETPATAGDPQGGSVTTPVGLTAAATVEPSFSKTERDRVRTTLGEFKNYDPPVFEGETTDPWVVEKWVDTMEKLFEDLLMEEYERVPLAVHFLEGNARMWWKTVRPDVAKGAALPTWSSFQEKLFGAFFPHSLKQQMEDDLKNIK